MNVAGSLETGRVEVGESSNQQLVETFGEFSNYMETCVVWKINPMSQKPIQAGEIRQYCTGCRTRIKKASWKFCPTCGENLKD
jgi:rRNA maturation endonuclease Nob1